MFGMRATESEVRVQLCLHTFHLIHNSLRSEMMESVDNLACSFGFYTQFIIPMVQPNHGWLLREIGCDFSCWLFFFSPAVVCSVSASEIMVFWCIDCISNGWWLSILIKRNFPPNCLRLLNRIARLFGWWYEGDERWTFWILCVQLMHCSAPQMISKPDSVFSLTRFGVSADR